MTVQIRQLQGPGADRRSAFPSLLLVVAAGLVAVLLPLLSQEAEARDLRRPLVTVHLKKGGQLTLREAEFLRRQEGERPGSLPPGTPVGPTPGNIPGVGDSGGPGDDPGGLGGRDPRQPTRGIGFDPHGRGDGFGTGLSDRQLHLLRRVDIVRVEDRITYVDLTYKNGDLRSNVPMAWTAVSGWERPGKEGEFYLLETEDILYLEFPSY